MQSRIRIITDITSLFEVWTNLAAREGTGGIYGKMRFSTLVIRKVISSAYLWGLGVCAAWYSLVLWGPLNTPTIRSLFADHPLEYAATVLFFIGLAYLGIRWREIAVQRSWLRSDRLPAALSAEGLPLEPKRLLSRLEELPEPLANHPLVRRLSSALQYVEAGDNPAGSMEEHLQYLAQRDAEEAVSRFGLVRMFIWAIPIVGFLGTVVGIAMAMGKLAPQQLEASLPEVMASLTVAFNTTILALGLCLVLYFALFSVQRQEEQFLRQVDDMASRVIQKLQLGPAGRAVAPALGFTQVLEALRGVAAGMERLTEELGYRFVESLKPFWQKATQQMVEDIQSGLTQAMATQLEIHAERLGELERQLLEEQQRRLRAQEAEFQRHSEHVMALERGVEERTEVLIRALDAAQTLKTLQEALARNLAVLAASQQFEQMVMSLTAAMHLFTARLDQVTGTGLKPADVFPVRKAG